MILYLKPGVENIKIFSIIYGQNPIMSSRMSLVDTTPNQFEVWIVLEEIDLY